jgi:hypothetical protein
MGGAGIGASAGAGGMLIMAGAGAGGTPVMGGAGSGQGGGSGGQDPEEESFAVQFELVNASGVFAVVEMHPMACGGVRYWISLYQGNDPVALVGPGPCPIPVDAPVPPAVCSTLRELRMGDRITFNWSGTYLPRSLAECDQPVPVPSGTALWAQFCWELGRSLAGPTQSSEPRCETVSFVHGSTPVVSRQIVGF